MSRKNNIIIRLQRWIDSVPGQTFLNYAYSWGAAIVILGALFKLTHLKGGNLMLFLGMGTEVFIFFLSAFDRPFDKEEIGKELPKTFQSEEIKDLDEEQVENNLINSDVISPTTKGLIDKDSHRTSVKEDDQINIDIEKQNERAHNSEKMEDTHSYEQEIRKIDFTKESEQLASIIRMANDELLQRAQAVLSPEMEEATQVYIEKLKSLNETLHNVELQNQKLTKDSEEMENLNRTLTGINKVYELHLKSISLQVGTIDNINNQTQKLAEQIQRLNEVYGRMIDALTVNMSRQGGANSPSQQ